MDESTETIYQEIAKVAKSGGTTYYSDIAPLVGLDMGSHPDRNRISNILDEISRNEHANGKPLLSAVVISKARKLPGQGFFTLAQNLYLYDGNPDSELEFWVQELRRVHAHWTSKTQ